MVPQKHSFANPLLLPWDQEQSSQSFETAGWNGRSSVMQNEKLEEGSKRQGGNPIAFSNNPVGCYRKDRARCFLEVHKQNYWSQWTQAAIQWAVIQHKKKVLIVRVVRPCNRFPYRFGDVCPWKHSKFDLTVPWATWFACYLLSSMLTQVTFKETWTILWFYYYMHWYNIFKCSLWK